MTYSDLCLCGRLHELLEEKNHAAPLLLQIFTFLSNFHSYGTVANSLQKADLKMMLVHLIPELLIPLL
jgi:hypothetical protein